MLIGQFAGGVISIHALREEGDTTSSSARATSAISIHALREEGDVRSADGLLLL